MECISTQNIVQEKSKKEIHTGLKCSICGRTFDTKRGLVRHTYIHQSNPKFSCDTCGKIFTSQDSLLRHSKSHQRDKKIVHCKHCNESFSNKIQLEEHHRNVHLGQKLFRCSVCGAVFSWEENLQKHQRMHMVDNYRCEFCERIFCDTISLRIHQRVHRPSTKPPSPNCKPFHCSLCGQRFQFDFSYKAHMNSHKIDTANCTENITQSEKNNSLPEILHPERTLCETKESNMGMPYKINTPQKISGPLKPEDENDVFENSINTNRIPANEISIKARKAVPYKVSDEPQQVLKNAFQDKNTNEKRLMNNRNLKVRNVEKKVKHKVKEGNSHTDVKKRYPEEHSISDNPALKKRRVYNGRFGTLDMTDHKPFKCTKCTETFRWEVSLNVHLRVHEPGYQPYEEKNLTRKKMAKLLHQHKKLKKQPIASPLKSQLVKRRAGSDDEDDDFHTCLPSSRPVSKQRSTLDNSDNISCKSVKDVKTSDVFNKDETSVVKIKKQISSSKPISDKEEQQGEKNYVQNLNGITSKSSSASNLEDNGSHKKLLSTESVVITSITPIVRTSAFASGVCHKSKDKVGPADTITQSNNNTNALDVLCENDIKTTENQTLEGDMVSKEIEEDNKLEGRLVIDTLDETQLFINVESENETREEIWNQGLCNNNMQVTHGDENNSTSKHKSNLIAQSGVHNTSFHSLNNISGNTNVPEIFNDKGLVASSNLSRRNNDSGNQNILRKVELEIVDKTVKKKSEEESITAQSFSQGRFSTFNGPITEITPIPMPPVQANYEANVVENNISSISNMFPAENNSNISIPVMQEAESNNNSQCQVVMPINGTNATCNIKNNGVDFINQQNITGICTNTQTTQSSNSGIQASNANMLDYIQGGTLNENISDHQLLQGISNLMHVTSAENVEKYVSSDILKGMKESMQEPSTVENRESNMLQQNVMMNLSNTSSNCNMLPNIMNNSNISMVHELQNVQVSHDLAQNINVTQNVLQDVQFRQNINLPQNYGSATVQQIHVSQSQSDVQMVTTNCSEYNSGSIHIEPQNIPLSIVQSTISSESIPVTGVQKNSHYEDRTSQSMKLPVVQSLLSENISIQNDMSKKNVNLQAMQDVVYKIPVASSTQSINVQDNMHLDPSQYQNFGQISNKSDNFTSSQSTVSASANLQSNNHNYISDENKHQMINSMNPEKIKATVNVKQSTINGHSDLKAEDHKAAALNNLRQNISEQIKSMSSESLANSQSDLIVVDSNSPVTTMVDERTSEFQIQSAATGESGTTMQSILPSGTIQINITNTNAGQIIQQNIGSIATKISNQQNVVTSQSIPNNQIVPNMSSVMNNSLTNLPLVQSNMPVLPQNPILCPQVQGNVQFVQGSLPNLQSSMIPMHSNLQNSIQPLNTLGMGMQPGVTFLGNVPNMLSNVPVQAGYLSGQQINCLNEFGQIVAVTPLFQIPVNQNQLGNTVTGNILSQNPSVGILQSQQIMTQPVIGQTIIQNSGAVPSWQLSSGINNVDVQGSTTNSAMTLLNNGVAGPQFQSNPTIVDKLTQVPYQIPTVNFSSQLSNLQPQSNVNNFVQLDGCHHSEKCDEHLMYPYMKDAAQFRKSFGVNYVFPHCFKNHITWTCKLNKARKALVCFDCQKLFTSRFLFKVHRLTHRKRLLHCSPCGLNFPYGLRMIIHKFNHYKIKCKICAKIPKAIESLKRHSFFHQSLFQGIKCNVCGLMFLEVKGLFKHMVVHCDDLPDDRSVSVVNIIKSVYY